MRCVAVILIASGLLAARTGRADPWKTKENCTFIAKEAYDGDSFHVKWNTRHYIFRLYFVDTPETDDRIPERVAEQAAYFGVDAKTALRIGREGAEFTRKFLEKQPFTVYTKLSDARGASDRDRDYAFIEADGRDLGEALVAAGFARVFGMEIDPPHTTATTYRWRLLSAEREARKQKLGGWGMAAGASSPAERFGTTNLTAGITEHDLVTPQTIAVYSLKEPFAQIGMLQRGARLRVLRAESPTMVRIRFSTSDGRVLEAQCGRAYLGL
jgi:endonuclease YncB( thermonuclease family)